MGREYILEGVTACEKDAVERATKGLVIGDFRVCTLLPDGKWDIEFVSSWRVANAMFVDVEPEVAVVLLKIWRTPINRDPKVKVLAAHPGLLDPVTLGQKYVPVLIGAVKHPAVLEKYRTTR